MTEYKLELKQVVDYPRCRIYRSFVQNLIKDQSIRTNGCPGLFDFTVLCTYTNFRTSYRRINWITYTVYPGEWICRLSELKENFRLRSNRQVLAVLRSFQERGLIRFSLLGQDKIVKYSICNWIRFNRILDYALLLFSTSMTAHIRNCERGSFRAYMKKQRDRKLIFC